MSHYFIDDHDLNHEYREIKFEFNGFPFKFVSDNGVFSKDAVDYGSKILIETVLKYDLKKTVLDLGCGYGVISIVLNKFKDCKFIGVDINSRAINLANKNAELNKLDIEYRISNGFENVSEKFDTILLNPPIRTGKENIYKMFDDSFKHLESNGTLWIVIRKQHGAQSAMNELSKLFECSIVNKEKGYWVIRAIKY